MKIVKTYIALTLLVSAGPARCMNEGFQQQQSDSSINVAHASAINHPNTVYIHQSGSHIHKQQENAHIRHHPEDFSGDNEWSEFHRKASNAFAAGIYSGLKHSGEMLLVTTITVISKICYDKYMEATQNQISEEIEEMLNKQAMLKIEKSVLETQNLELQNAILSLKLNKEFAALKAAQPEQAAALQKALFAQHAPTPA